MPKEALNTTAEDMSTLRSTNFESVFHLSKLAHPLLKASGNGIIVFISSVAGVTAAPLTPLYGPYNGNESFYLEVFYDWNKYEIVHMHINTFYVHLSLQEP